MAQMRFQGERRPRDLRQVARPDTRPPAAPGDAPIVPAEPPQVRWSLSSYPYPDPTLDEQPATGADDTPHDAAPAPAAASKSRRKRTGGTPADRSGQRS